MTKGQYKIFNRITKHKKIQNKVQNKVNIKELYKRDSVNEFTMRKISNFSSFCLMSVNNYHGFFSEYNNSVNFVQNTILALKDYFVTKYYPEKQFFWFSELYTDYQSIFDEFYLWLKYQVIPKL